MASTPSQTAVVHSPVLSPSNLSPDLVWPLANSPAFRARRCVRTQFPGETCSLDRERSLNTTAAVALSPRTPNRVRKCSPSASSQSAEGSWAEAVATGRRKDGERSAAALSSLGSSSASEGLSPCGGGGSPAWRPAALAAVRSPLAPVVRHRATASADMEELWAEEASDETSGATRKPRRNRNIIRRARNVSSDLPSLRSTQGDEKPGNVDSGRASIGGPKPPPWEGEAPVSAESLQEGDVSAARPSIISRRPAATAIRKLRIFSNRGGRDAAALAAAFAATAGSSATGAAASPPAGNGVAAEEVEGVSAQPSRGTRDRLTAKSAGGGGTILKSSPQRRRGRAGGAVRRRIRRSFSECEEEPAATVVPFVRRESQRPSRESSQPSHIIMRSLSSGDGRQEAAGQENADALRAPPRSGDASEMTKRSGETGGEESRWRNGGQRAASYHEELASDLVEYFGEIAQSWSIEGSSRECDLAVGAEAVGAAGESPFGEAGRGMEGVGRAEGTEEGGLVEGMDVGGRLEGMEEEGRVVSWRMCSLSSVRGGCERRLMAGDAEEEVEEREKGRSRRGCGSRATSLVCLLPSREGSY